MAGVPYNPNGGSASSQRDAIARRRSGSSGGGSRGKPGGVTMTGGAGREPAGARLRRNRIAAAQGAGTDWDAFIADLLGQYSDGSGGGGGGGYGGGGGGGVDISGLLAAAKAKYDETNGKVGDLYGDLAKTYEVLPAQTKQRYDQAIAAGNAGAGQVVSGNRARVDKEAATNAAAAARLGIATDSVAPSETAKESEYANQQLQLQAGNWAGLMGTARESQVGRDNANTQGARDAGVLAQEELRKQYEAYVANLQAQAASGGGGGGGGYSGGGGGGGSRTGNKLLDKMNEAMLVYALAQKGIYTNAWSVSAYNQKPSIYEELGLTPAQYNAGAARYAANGTNAAARSIQGGMSPAQVAAYRKAFG